MRNVLQILVLLALAAEAMPAAVSDETIDSAQLRERFDGGFADELCEDFS